MKMTFNYKEDLMPAINAMMQSASKDEYVDANPPSAFKKSIQKKQLIANLNVWREIRMAYKETMSHAIDAMMASAENDKYVDCNKPMF